MKKEKETNFDEKGKTDTVNEISESDKEKLSEAEELMNFRKEKELREKIRTDLEVLHELFPELKVEDIPDEVWEKVALGESLSGAFAINFIRKMNEEKKVLEVNEKNSKSALPPINGAPEDDFFSPECVKNMSEKEVRKNYSKILKSMEKWNH